MTARFDIAIVGAGPAGSSLAILLARSGWSVALIERQPFPRRKVCGECIAASNLELLDALGVGDEFDRRAGAELRRVALMRGARIVIAPLPRADDAARRWGRALGREHLDPMLANAAEAAGAIRLQPCTVQAIDGVAGSYRLALRPADTAGGDRVIEAAVVVAAHGSWEPLPADREADRSTRSASDLLAFKANFRHAELAADLLPVLSFDGGYGGMVLAEDGMATLAGCIRTDRLQALRADAPGESAGAAVEAMLRRDCAGVATALANATREGAWLASGPLRPGIRLGRGDGIFRIGNAAGEAHPIIGEGISMAMQSAFVLANEIRMIRTQLVDPAQAVDAHRRALQRYEARWRRRFARRVQVAAMLAHIAMRPRLAVAAWPLVRGWPGVLTQGARLSGKSRTAPEAQALARAGL